MWMQLARFVSLSHAENWEKRTERTRNPWDFKVLLPEKASKIIIYCLRDSIDYLRSKNKFHGQ
jgi:hypothetical protein